MKQLSLYVLFTWWVVSSGAGMAQEHRISVQKFEPPRYPAVARQAHIEGEVKVAVKLSPTGEVIEAEVMRGHPMLKQVALDNIKKWRFHCDDCAYGESFSHEMTYSFEIDNGEHGNRSVRYQFPDRLFVYSETPIPVGLFAPELPSYFWLWKVFHPRYWSFHGFD